MQPAVLAFARRALALKDTARRGWMRAGIERPESVADHSWGLALLALLEARARGLDEARAVELALLHDVCEAVTGDLTPGEYANREEKLALEWAGLARLLADAPEDVCDFIIGVFEEYAAGQTPEARLVRDLDKVEMAMQARRYETAGIAAERLDEFVTSARAAVSDAALRDLC